MKKLVIPFLILCLVFGYGKLQSKFKTHQPAPVAVFASPNAANDFSALNGTWKYRSFLNNAQDVSFSSIRFGEGTFTLAVNNSDNITGKLNMGGVELTITGKATNKDDVIHVKMKGDGVANTPTAGWVYEYEGFVLPKWSNGTDQKNVIAGSVIRSVEHDGNPAGFVGSMYMIKK